MDPRKTGPSPFSGGITQTLPDVGDHPSLVPSAFPSPVDSAKVVPGSSPPTAISTSILMADVPGNGPGGAIIFTASINCCPFLRSYLAYSTYSLPSIFTSRSPGTFSKYVLGNNTNYFGVAIIALTASARVGAPHALSSVSYRAAGGTAPLASITGPSRLDFHPGGPSDRNNGIF